MFSLSKKINGGVGLVTAVNSVLHTENELFTVGNCAEDPKRSSTVIFVLLYPLRDFKANYDYEDTINRIQRPVGAPDEWGAALYLFKSSFSGPFCHQSRSGI